MRSRFRGRNRPFFVNFNTYIENWPPENLEEKIKILKEKEIDELQVDTESLLGEIKDLLNDKEYSILHDRFWKNKTLQECLNYIQVNLKAPKNMTNNFGNYKYRNLEGIFDAIDVSKESIQIAGKNILNNNVNVSLSDINVLITLLSKNIYYKILIIKCL